MCIGGCVIAHNELGFDIDIDQLVNLDEERPDDTPCPILLLQIYMEAHLGPFRTTASVWGGENLARALPQCCCG